MNADFLQNLVSANMPGLTARTVNGSCRFLAPSDPEATNDNGFPNSGYQRRTDSFFPCSWTAKTTSNEKNVAFQTRASFVYEITVPKIWEDAPVLAEPSDKLEILFVPGGAVQTVEIVSLINQANVAWLVYAVDIEE